MQRFQRGHYASLDTADLPAFLAALEATTGNIMVNFAVRLLMLTGLQKFVKEHLRELWYNSRRILAVYRPGRIRQFLSLWYGLDNYTDDFIVSMAGGLLYAKQTLNRIN